MPEIPNPCPTKRQFVPNQTQGVPKNKKKKPTQSTSFADFEIVPILLFVFQTRGCLGRGPLAAQTYKIHQQIQIITK
jgi:hypothetical protein